MPLMMLISILFLYEWLSKWKRSQTTRNLVLTIICILIIVPFRPYFGFTAIPNTHYFFWPIRTFSQFLNHDFVRRKEVKSNQSILAHWDYGHWLLYYTGLPVISSPFQGSSAMEVLDLFTSKGTKSIDTFIQKYPTRFLILEAGAQRSLNWIETAGKDKNIYFEKIGEVDGQDQFKTTPIFEDLFMYRFFFEMGLDLDNNHPQHWRLIYISPYASPVEKDIPALKVFEYVPGVTIHLHTKKQYAELYIQAEIKQLGEGFLYQQSTKGTHDFTWTVPYGTYDQASVGFDGKYVIRDENGKILHTISEITEKQVLAGDSLKIQF